MFAQTYNNTFISQNNNYDILINQLDKLGWPTLLSKKEQTKLTKPASNPKTIAPPDITFTTVYLPSSDIMARCIRISIDDDLFVNLL